MSAQSRGETSSMAHRGAVHPNWWYSQTRSERVTLAATFVLAMAGSLFLTLGVGLQNSPKVTLYTSGLSAFPSPLGTAFGTALGVEGLAVLQALALGGVAASIVALRVPLRCIVAALPVLIWTAPLGMAVIAGSIFAWGWLIRREWWYWVAAGFHLSILLLIAATTRTRWIALSALAAGVAFLATTPYGEGLRTGAELERLPQALMGGAIVGALALLPGFIGGVRVWNGPVMPLGLAVAVAAAFAVRYDLSDGYTLWTSVPQTVRYAFPVVLVCLIETTRVTPR